MKRKIVRTAQKMMLLSLAWVMGLLFAGAVLDIASYIIPFARIFPLPLAGKIIVYSGGMITVGFLLISKHGMFGKK
ncbi:hypothetical protein [Klebsiella sp. PL-2018]|uniref:hypothetical protein n=1 Tax=Klebsiella sp. PL-2018 TaxID=2851540 RepID=UPI001C240859|nr:hypothetical protein [Klebsiella sp. PL-2018]QXD01276.1 hypothetical protein MKleb_5775 [Klebsiella sp. PL-2018]